MVAHAYDESRALHSHRCMRCGEEFTCRTPETCEAQYDVLPSIITLGPDGIPRVSQHCAPLPPIATRGETP